MFIQYAQYLLYRVGGWLDVMGPYNYAGEPASLSERHIRPCSRHGSAEECIRNHVCKELVERNGEYDVCVHWHSAKLIKKTGSCLRTGPLRFVLSYQNVQVREN